MAKLKYGTLFHTDTSTYLNSNEIPTFSYMGKITLIAQDPENYGFDCSYNNETITLTLSYNPQKTITPMPTTEYKGKEGKTARSISTTDKKIEIKKGEESYILENSYNTNGYMCLFLDDLLSIYDVNWNQEQRRADITIG